MYTYDPLPGFNVKEHGAFGDGFTDDTIAYKIL